MQPTSIFDSEGNVYAQVINPYCNEKNTTTWIAKSHESLQGSVMRYDAREFKNHKHILNPRIIKRTQECFIVISGKVKVTIYNEKNQSLMGSLEAIKGEALFVWNGYHKVEFLEEDTVAYEIKAGSFSTVSEDKEYFR